ncbi:MAG TPA: HD domain-containing phosphohydrolase [Gemmatimonadaceae bacterium]|nr:HD domain-containing phosphohydrolase [Gemmatimonadaceae bacterium]
MSRTMMSKAGVTAPDKPGRILIIDDQEANVHLLERILANAGYEDVASTTNSADALRLQTQFKPDLVLLDVHMSGKDGFEVLEEIVLHAGGSEQVPVLMITADDSADAKRRALALGAKDFLSKPFDSAEILLRIRNLLETRFLYRKLRRQNTELELKVTERTKELEQSQLEMLERLAAAVEFRDDDTGNHTKRVAQVSAILGEAIGLEATTVELIRRAAPLHDIGKVGIPDNILLKAGPLTGEEFEIMKTHTVIGSRMLSKGRSELVRFSQRVARSHHEWWDGSGYPDRVSGQAIPLEARIVAAADFLDALTHDRPYRPAWGIDDTLAEIKRRAGSHFDPTIAKALLGIDWRASAVLVA